MIQGLLLDSYLCKEKDSSGHHSGLRINLVPEKGRSNNRILETLQNPEEKYNVLSNLKVLIHSAKSNLYSSKYAIGFNPMAYYQIIYFRRPAPPSSASLQRISWRCGSS